MGSGFGFGIPGIGMVIVWGFIIFFVLWIARGASGMKSGRDRQAREILDERFARGEIERVEYEEKKRALD